MPYSSIADNEIDADSPITQSVMQRLRDNASVGKASRGRVFTSNATWTVPADVEAIRATVIGGGGASQGTNDGGNGGAIVIWASVSSGDDLSINVGPAGGNSRITGIARARGGSNATEDNDGTRGTVDDIQASAHYLLFQNETYLNSTGAVHGSPGVEGLVIIEY